jgi:hypothetical protein
MYIWDKKAKAVLNFLLSSTASKFCFTEIVEGSSLSRHSVSLILPKLNRC